MRASRPRNQAADARTLIWAAAYWVLIAVFIVTYLHVHQLAAFTFPVPWEDESDWLWMAISFARSGSLHAPQVSSRPVFFMPPAWMQNRAQQELRGAAAQPSAEVHMLQQRDGTEAWYYRVAPVAQ